MGTVAFLCFLLASFGNIDRNQLEAESTGYVTGSLWWAWSSIMGISKAPSGDSSARLSLPTPSGNILALLIPGGLLGAIGA